MATEKFKFGTYNTEDTGSPFEDPSYVQVPSEKEARKQLGHPLVELQKYINNYVSSSDTSTEEIKKEISDNKKELEDTIASDKKELQGNIDTLGTKVETYNTARVKEITELGNKLGTETSDRKASDEAIKSSINTTNSNVTALTTRVTNTEKDISALKTKTDTTNANVTKNASNISSLQTGLNTANTNISTNKSDISALKTKTDNTNTQVSTNTKNIASHQTILDKYKGGKTGQILAKKSNTDHDVNWVDSVISEAEVKDLRERIEDLEYMIVHNDFFAPLMNDDGTVLLLDDSTPLLNDWKY